jgi:putative transposase
LLACTNIFENVMGTVRRVCRNVKYWRSPSMSLRWVTAATQEAFKGSRRLKAKKHLPALRAALAKQGQQRPSDETLVQIAEAA